MIVDASATCRYLTPAARKKADMRERICTLKCVATCSGDGQLLLAVYNFIMDGGSIDITTPKGFTFGATKTNDVEEPK